MKKRWYVLMILMFLTCAIMLNLDLPDHGESLNERVRLVRLHYPEVEVSESPSSRVTYCQRNRFGFLDVAVTEDKVYALYSGKTYKMDRGRAFESNCLLVYEWEGDLIRTLYFGDALTGISYDREEGMLYGITGSGSLIRVNCQ